MKPSNFSQMGMAPMAPTTRNDASVRTASPRRAMYASAKAASTDKKSIQFQTLFIMDSSCPNFDMTTACAASRARTYSAHTKRTPKMR
eukprot:scaffold5517_cov239-Pinguiococcus_pyrenoidosus.AAC.4